ncbi:MAG: hypothetical protein A2Y80_00090 [Deltaproteobacteria bacterium RBG_13_58_19]|nr:MAG: hypothetical protein A2Y80_00090 [Deltaproteobacteria bacterium RBG_13_58_19]
MKIHLPGGLGKGFFNYGVLIVNVTNQIVVIADGSETYQLTENSIYLDHIYSFCWLGDKRRFGQVTLHSRITF